MPIVFRAALARPIITVALAAAVAASFVFAQPQPAAASAGPSCSGWNSLTQPPRTIRVLRLRSGRVQTVSFRKYVVTVMGKEWPSYLPQSVVEAGAVAVKQYAWYHAVYSSRSSSGRCFDVKDGTGAQLYKPGKTRVRPDHHDAVDATWNVTLRKNGRFFMTGYRRGDKVRCGRDATGYKLFARSAVQCARRGLGWREILRKYYGPSLELVVSGGSSAAALPTRSRAVAQQAKGRRAAEAPARPAPRKAVGMGGSATGGLADALRALDALDEVVL